MKPTPIALAFVAATLSLATVSTAIAAEKQKEKQKEEETGKKKEETKPYKLDTCIVSGEKLGEMGDPVVFVHEGQEIKLCCKKCRKTFDKDPAKYLKKLEEAEKKPTGK